MSERGNALFLILIAVALFAALSYAITQSGRGGGNISAQTALIAAGQVTEAPADIRAAVSRMVLSGVAANTITFSGADASTNVFGQSLGGGAVNVPPPNAACVLNDCSGWGFWYYVQATTSSASGVFVAGVGSASTTASTANGGDAFAVLEGTNGVTSTVCTAIQKGLGFASPYTPPVVGPSINWLPGPYLYTGNTYSIAVPALQGQEFACFEQGSGSYAGIYAYYGVLFDE
jgi:hypothetical protein